MVRKSVLFSLAIVALGIVTIYSQAQSVLTHHVREATRNGRAKSLRRLPADQVLQLNIVLPLSDQAGLDAFLKDVYDPSSPHYRHFLTVAEFTSRFGPSQKNYNAVLHFAKNSNLTVVGGSRDGMDVQVKGTVSAIEKAFHVKMRTYQHPTENRTFYAPDREPTTDLPFSLWHISGLDNYSIPHPLFVKKSDYAKAHGIKPADVVTHATTGSGPSASFLGSDMRAAYYGGTALTGAGQNLGLFEYAGTDLADLTTYFNNVGQTNNVPDHPALDGRHQHLLRRFERRRQLRRHRADPGHDPGHRHGSRPGQPGHVRRLHRHRHHQRHDHAQPAAHHHRLLLGLDAGRSHHARPLLRKDGRAGPELLCGLRRQLHLVGEQ